MKAVKIVLSIVLIIILILVIMGLLMSTFITSNTKERAPKEEILKGSNVASKKALIIYQPAKSAITTNIAHEIGKGLQSSGYEVVLNYPGAALSTDVSAYSLVIFGSPVYAEPSKVLTKYMASINDFSGKKVVLFSTGAAANEKDLDIMESALSTKKADKRIKFYTKEKNKNLEYAYTLGQELGKE